MKETRLGWTTAALFAGLVIGGIAWSQDGGDKDEAKAAEEKAMMEAWMKAADPGENHKLLEKMAGKWKTVTKMAMQGDSGGPEGSSESEMILGGRFLQFRHKGEFMGQPFEGVGLLGYDNVKKKFVTVWIENMSTHIVAAEGTCDEAKKVITLAGEYLDPMSGGKIKMGFRWIWTIQSDDAFAFEMWEIPPADKGPEYKAMAIEYTRKK